MLTWFLLAGREPEKIVDTFNQFYKNHQFPRGTALWKWKNSYWICSTEDYKHNMIHEFEEFRIIEFSSAPSPGDLEFLAGDNNALTV